MIESIVAAIVPELIDLIKNAVSDTYDKDKELQLMIQLQRKISDAREAAISAPSVA